MEPKQDRIKIYYCRLKHRSVSDYLFVDADGFVLQLEFLEAQGHVEFNYVRVFDFFFAADQLSIDG